MSIGGNQDSGLKIIRLIQSGLPVKVTHKNEELERRLLAEIDEKADNPRGYRFDGTIQIALEGVREL